MCPPVCQLPHQGRQLLGQMLQYITNAYIAVAKSHFRKCEHLAILLQPTYTKRLKANPVTVRTVKMWTEDALAELQGCLEATDMNIFKPATDNIYDCTDTVSSYIDWCTSVCIPTRSLRLFPNQKPWFNAEVHNKIRNQCTAFKSGNIMDKRHARYKLQKSIRAAKRTYTEGLATGKTTIAACGRESNQLPTAERSQTEL